MNIYEVEVTKLCILQYKVAKFGVRNVFSVIENVRDDLCETEIGSASLGNPS